MSTKFTFNHQQNGTNGNGHTNNDGNGFDYSTPSSPQVPSPSSSPLPSPPPPPRQANPEETASYFSYLSSSWLNPLIERGAKRSLEDTDLSEVRSDYGAHALSERFQSLWTDECQMAAAANASPSLLRVLRVMFARKYFMALAAKVASDLLTITQPLLLERILDYIADPEGERYTIWYGILIALALFATAFGSAFLNSLYFRTTMGVGQQVRTCLITAVFRKSLRLSNRARQLIGTGQIVNLISTDASKIDAAIGWGQGVIASLIQLSISIILLVRLLGVISLTGIAIIIVLLPLQSYVVRIIQRLRAATVSITDSRVKLTSEILHGIKVIRVYAWEKAFTQQIGTIRSHEMTKTRRAMYVRAYNVAIAQFGPILMSLTAFTLLALTGTALTPENVFASLVLFNQLRFPLIQVPFVGGMIAEARVSYLRIYKMLIAEEVESAKDSETEHLSNPQNPIGIEVKRGEWTWDAVISDEAKDKDKKAEERNGHDRGRDERRAETIAEPLLDGADDKDEDLSMRGARRGHGKRHHWYDRFSFLIRHQNRRTEPTELLLADMSSRPSSLPNSPSMSLPSSPSHQRSQDSADLPSQISISSGDAVAPVVLHNINLRIRKGSLVAIVGSVGGGKSSLLNALLGQMKRLNGTVNIDGSVAYCPQQAWIQHATLRENILFGLPYDAERYATVVRVCSLESDIALLPHGDMTEIGEKGVTLSGGQKQRVNIARAAYFNPDIVLLDDVFSALDARVGREIFEKCVLSQMCKATRLLVTHHLPFVSHCDYVILMKDGHIMEQGTYAELMSLKGGLSDLMIQYGGSEVDIKAENPSTATSLKQSSSIEALNLIRRRRGGVGYLMQNEERATGKISWSTWMYYFAALGGWQMCSLILFCNILTVASKVVTDVWLSLWSEDELNLAPHLYVVVYVVLGIAQCVTVVMMTLSMSRGAISAAINIHNNSFDSVMRAPLSFFDTTPLGRILARFSKDQDTIDTSLGDSLRAVIQLLGQIAGTLFIIAYMLWIVLVPLIPLLYFYIRTQAIFRLSSREVKRMDSLSRSPLFAHFSETLTGLSTIRAYKRQIHFIYTNEIKLDGNNRPYFTGLCLARWIGLRLELYGALIIAFVALAIVFCRGVSFVPVTVGSAGLAMTYALTITASFALLIRQGVEAENNMNAVERTKYYSDSIEQERPAVLPTDQSLISTAASSSSSNHQWPFVGRVEFDDICMRYRTGLPFSLQNVSFVVPGGERVGVVGRTGAGKSSLTAALFRLSECESGRILIDGVDISKLGLETLRSRLSIIPQEPMLFTGTIRSNIDPFNQHTDADIMRVIDQSHLGALIRSNYDGINMRVSENAESLSMGQRCQLCLARAMLKQTKLIVLDEATASVDIETDTHIQHSLRTYFQGTTIITIAHRLLTVIDFDRIIVMSAGQIAEIGTPIELLRRQDSQFAALVRETGEANAALLYQIAEQTEREKLARQQPTTTKWSK